MKPIAVSGFSDAWGSRLADHSLLAARRRGRLRVTRRAKLQKTYLIDLKDVEVVTGDDADDAGSTCAAALPRLIQSSTRCAW